jgi:hypothetical protein
MVEKLKKPHDFISFIVLNLILAIFSQQKKAGLTMVPLKSGGSNLSYCIKDLLYFL